MGPLKRYQEAFSAGRYIPTLQVTNYMNREAIVQVTLSPARYCLCMEVNGLASSSGRQPRHLHDHNGVWPRGGNDELAKIYKLCHDHLQQTS